MKKLAFIIFALFLANNCWGQFWGGPPFMGVGNTQEGDSVITPPTPAEIATEITDTLQTLLNLNQKQYKKVYKIALKEQRKIYNDSINDMIPDFGGFGFGGPDFGGGGGYTKSPEKIAADKRKEQEKTAAKREKAMVKILTPEQYAIYQKLDIKAIFRVKEVTVESEKKE